jgi:hypothetical protein
MKGALLHGFIDQHRDRLIAGVEARLAARGIEDLENGEIMISGKPSDFVITVHGRQYHGRLGVWTFDSDLKFLLDRFAGWLTFIDRIPVVLHRNALSVSGTRIPLTEIERGPVNIVGLSPRDVIDIVRRANSLKSGKGRPHKTPA